MKKNISVICITIILLCLTACGSKTAEESKTTENQSTGNQGEYYDLEVTEQQLWSQETQDTGSYQSMGMQFYRGEPVRFLGIPHREEGEEKTRGIDIYLEKADGSRELLFGKMPEAYGLYSVLLDGEDGMYLYDPATIIRLDSEGKELYCSIVSAATKGVATDICLLPNDRLLVRSLDNSTSKTTLWIMDGTTGKFAEKDIGMNITSTGYIAAGEEGAYLLDLFGVWSVNEKDGSKKSAFLFEGTSYAISFSGRKDSRKVMDFQIPEEGTLELLWRKNGEYSIETLRLKSVEEKTVITLRSTAVYGQIKNWIAEFNQTNEKYHIVIDECREGTDINDFVTQTGIQLATGKGADLFYGIEARSTMWSLMEKGAFEDLKPYMEASGIREEDYFPFVFDVLRKDNKIYGVYPFVSAEKYYISEEIMGEYGAPENVEALADALLAYKEKAVLIDNYTSPLVLEWFFKGSENLWGMLDWENGSCDFSGELFAKLLKVSKRYGYDERNNYPELLRWLGAYKFDQYVLTENVQWNGNVPAGPFFDDGCYAVSDDYVTFYISATSEHKEGAWEFIEFCLNSETQRSADRPVQKEAFWKQAEERIAGDKALALKGMLMSEPMTMEKAEAMEQILNSTHCYPIRTAPVLDIVIEEAGAYFSGTKSIEEVVAIIENRVGLYLEENK